VYSGQVLNNVRTVYNKMDEPRGIRGDDHKWIQRFSRKT
jgi:hypothetical protein